jgi:hypothetical protein
MPFEVAQSHPVLVEGCLIAVNENNGEKTNKINLASAHLAPLLAFAQLGKKKKKSHKVTVSGNMNIRVSISQSKNILFATWKIGK